MCVLQLFIQDNPSPCWVQYKSQEKPSLHEFTTTITLITPRMPPASGGFILMVSAFSTALQEPTIDVCFLEHDELPAPAGSVNTFSRGEQIKTLEVMFIRGVSPTVTGV